MSLNYTEEELNLLANTPHIIGTAMAFAGSSGLFGTGKEMFVNAQAVMSGVKDYKQFCPMSKVMHLKQWLK